MCDISEKIPDPWLHIAKNPRGDMIKIVYIVNKIARQQR